MESRLKIVLSALVGVFCFLPYLLTALLRIHPTTAMVHEQLSINYVTYDALGIDYFFTETGQFSILLLAYPASIVSHFVVGGASNYLRIMAFAEAYYITHGVLLWIISLRIIWKGRLRPSATIALILVPFMIPAVEQVTNVGLMINYDKANDLIFFILGYLGILSFRKGADFHWPAWAGAGSLVGFAAGIKLSIGIVAGLFVVAFLLSGSDFRSWRVLVGRSVAAAFGASGIFVVGLWVFHRLNLHYTMRFIADTAALYRSGFLSQHTPFLADELSKFLSPESYYFAWEILVIAWLASLSVFCWVSYRRSNFKRGWSLVICELLVFGFLAFQLFMRFTQGTMIDVTVVLGMALVVNVVAAELIDLPKSQMAWSKCLVGTMLLIMAIGIGTAQLSRRFSSMIKNSRELARMESLLARHKDLDYIYFGTYLSQPIVFPSPDLIILMKTSTSSAARFMQKMAPRMKWSSFESRWPGGSFIAVVPDCIETPPRTPANLAKWPEMYAPYDADKLFPVLLSRLTVCSTERLSLQFTPLQSDKQLLYYFLYPTRVRIFVVNYPHPPN